MRLSFLLLALSCATASPAFANSQYQNQIPNGLAVGCPACHPGGVMTQRTLFGEDARTTLVGGNVNWSALWMLDSDNDTQTNGQELGDPCGVWRIGQQPARRVEISNPGVAASISDTPDEPGCGPPDAGVIDTGVIDTGQPDNGVPDTGVQPPPDTGVRDNGVRDTGVVIRPDAGVGADGGQEIIVESCGCNTTRTGSGSIAWLLAALLVVRRGSLRKP